MPERWFVPLSFPRSSVFLALTDRIFSQASGPAVEGSPISSEKWKKVCDDIREIWLRPLDELPAFKDLPRLAHKFHIYNKDGVRIDPNAEDVTTPRSGKSTFTESSSPQVVETPAAANTTYVCCFVKRITISN